MIHWKLRQPVEPGIVPRVGDVVLARKSPVNPFARALVQHVRPTRDGDRVRVALVWLGGPRTGQRDTVYTPADGWPPMIRSAP